MITDEMVERATEVWYSLPLQTRDADRFRRTIEAAIGDMVLVPRESAKMVSHVCAEWIDLFRDAPGIDKCERFSYEPAVEELRDEYAAIAAHSDTGEGREVGAVDAGSVDRLLNNLKSERKVQRKFFNALKKGTVTDQLRMQLGNARALTDAAADAVSSTSHTSDARDAARYRKVRTLLYSQNLDIGEGELSLHFYGAAPTLEQFDAAIDAAMRQEAE